MPGMTKRHTARLITCLASFLYREKGRRTLISLIDFWLRISFKSVKLRMEFFSPETLA